MNILFSGLGFKKQGWQADHCNAVTSEAFSAWAEWDFHLMTSFSNFLFLYSFRICFNSFSQSELLSVYFMWGNLFSTLSCVYSKMKLSVCVSFWVPVYVLSTNLLFSFLQQFIFLFYNSLFKKGEMLHY